MELFYVYFVSSFACLVLAVYPAIQRVNKEKYYSRLPKSIRNKNGKINIDKKILKIVERNHKSLIQSAESKFTVDRGPARVLENEEVALRAEKYAVVYFDDFTDEISDGLLDWNNENTELFFNSIHQNYGVTNRALLKTLLYLRHEIKYFNFRDSIMRRAPESLEEILEKKIMYEKTNEEEPVFKYEIKRLACEVGFGLPLVPMHIALRKAKKSLKAKQFSDDFIKKKNRVEGTADLRLVENSWQEAVKVDSVEDIDVSPDSYVIVGRDNNGGNKLEVFFKKHLKYALVDHFDSECADCKTKVNLQLDHFWLPKCKGANLVMRSKKGHYVNNCIPLCQSCNASKGAKSAYEYFGLERMNEILIQSQKFDAFLNEHLQNFDDPDFNVVPRLSINKNNNDDGSEEAA